MPFAVAALFGAIAGSFVNVVAYRLPRRQSLLFPGSRCPGCETPIKPYDNLPVLGWLLLQLAGNGHLAAALLLPLYYVADATITLLRRMARGEPITQAHRSHFYQLATTRGYSVMGVVRRVFAANVVLVWLESALYPNFVVCSFQSVTLSSRPALSYARVTALPLG